MNDARRVFVAHPIQGCDRRRDARQGRRLRRRSGECVDRVGATLAVARIRDVAALHTMAAAGRDKPVPYGISRAVCLFDATTADACVDAAVEAQTRRGDPCGRPHRTTHTHRRRTGRVAEGGCPPPAPADPDVRNSRIRLLGPWHRCADAHPRAAVSDDSPLAAGLALRRRLAQCPDRLSARQSMIRSAASLRRVPVGRVPRLPRYYQRTPTSRRPSRRASSSFAWRYHRLPCSLPPARAVPAGRDCCLWRPSTPHRRWRRRDLPGSWATPACMPRSPTPAEPPAPGQSRRLDGAFRSCHSVGFRDTDFVAQSRGLQGFLCTLRSRGRPRTTQHSVPAGWPALAGQVSHLLGRNRRFPSCHRMHFPLRQASPGARQARPLRSPASDVGAGRGFKAQHGRSCRSHNGKIGDRDRFG